MSSALRGFPVAPHHAFVTLGNLVMTVPPRDAPTPPVHQLKGWRRALVFCLSGFLRLWAATLRLQITPEAEADFRAGQKGGVVVLWHNRLFIYARLYRRYFAPTKMSALISASRDGAWLAALYEFLGMEAVRGSSAKPGQAATRDKRGATAARELMKRLAEGGLVALTVDGPRGPLYTVNEGAALVAARSKAPVLVIVPHFQRAWRLRSWDVFFLPWPFSQVTLKLERYDNINSLTDRTDRASVGKALDDALRRLSAGSDPAHGL